MATRGKMEHQMEQQLDVVEKYYLDEINVINTWHISSTKKLDGQMVVSCPLTIYNNVSHPLYTNYYSPIQEMHLEIKAAKESIDKLKIRHKNALTTVRNVHAKAV